MMHLCLALVHRVFARSVWRRNKHERITFDRHIVLTLRQVHTRRFEVAATCLTRGCPCFQRICSRAKLSPFPTHLLHDHLVVLLKVAALNDPNNGRDIIGRGGIAALLNACRPSLVVIGRKAADIFLVTGCHEDFGMVLIALPYIVILLELLIGFIIVGKNVCPIELALYSEMVIGGSGKGTLAISRLDDALCQGHGRWYAIPAHLFHRELGILVDILLS